MEDYKLKQFQFQQKLTDVPATDSELYESRRSSVESTKLSQLPKLSGRLKPQVIVCFGCNGRLDLFDQVQESIRACRKCLQVYANLDTAFDEKAKRDKQELLEKFAAEVKR
jgi:hypothetical protein